VARRMLVMLATLVVATAVCTASAGAEFRYQSLGGAARTLWNSCPPVPLGAPCAFTQVEAETARTDVDSGSRDHDCVFIEQDRGVKLGDEVIQSFDHTDTNICGAASVVVAASLTHARVTGTIPASNCHFDRGTEVQTCTPTTLRVSLDWVGTGDIARWSPVTYRYSYEPGQRCLEHVDAARRRQAVASGTIAGLPAPLGDLQADTPPTLFFGGVIIVGTDFGCYD
jgi:hypothetical protein